MLKVRLMGTKNDIVWFQKILQRHPKVEVLEISELYSNRSDKEKDGQATLPVRPKCFPIKWTLLIPNIKTNLLFRP